MNGLMCENTTFSFNVTGKVENIVEGSIVRGYLFKEFVIYPVGVDFPRIVSLPEEFMVRVLVSEEENDPTLMLSGVELDEMLNVRNALGVDPSAIITQSIHDFWGHLPKHFRIRHRAH